MSAYQVYANMRWRIESINPSYTKGIKRYIWNDRPQSLLGEQSSGMTRSFAIYFDGGAAIIEPTDGSGHARDIWLLLEIAYSTTLKLEDLHELILSDSHDLIVALRDDNGWRGYDNQHISDNIYLWKRYIEDERLDRTLPHTWYMRQRWRCIIWQEDTWLPH